MKHSNTDEAISLAMQGHWEEAVLANKSIIEVSPDDVDAYNRLGKALAQLGNYDEARKSYERALELDPTNGIARKNIKRLSNIKNGERLQKEALNINSTIFIEETGKSRVISLYRTAPKETLAKIAAGDHAYLQIKGKSLVVTNDSGEYLGEIEPKMASRLIDLIKGGNKYQTAIISSRDEKVKVIVREMYQHPSQVGYPSFPPKASDELKPYLKDMMVRYDIEEDLPGEPEEPGDLEGEVDPLWDEDAPAEADVPALTEEDVDIIV
ncbi:MAG: tetratricopeptide repeat protein, partial [Dehalococcoidia bacterium]